MACMNCKKIRDALLHGKMAEAVGLSVEALREQIGFKVEPKPLPASDLPSLAGKNKADLLGIAAAENVEVAPSATNAEIVEVIERHRQGLVEA